MAYRRRRHRNSGSRVGYAEDCDIVRTMEEEGLAEDPASSHRASRKAKDEQGVLRVLECPIILDYAAKVRSQILAKEQVMVQD